MKTHQYSTTAVLLLSLISANAGQAIYKSLGRETVVGKGQISKVPSKGFLVLDLRTTNITGTAIGGFTINNQKLFTVVPLQNYRLVQVTGPNGSTYDILAKAESPGT